MRYQITTNVEGAMIRQCVEFGGPAASQMVQQRVINVCEKQVREALIRMGWTPPKEETHGGPAGTTGEHHG